MKTFSLTLTLATAATVIAAAGCQRRPAEWSASAPTRFCVNAAGQRVEERYCRPGGGFGYHPYFIGFGGFIPPFGGYARGGGGVPLSGLRYGVPAIFTGTARGGVSSTVRGGFGASARGFGSGG